MAFPVPASHTAAFTVVTPNYLAHAYSLQESFLRHNPGSSFFIGLLGAAEQVPEKNNSAFVYLNELDDARIAGMKKRYNPFELSCALKPWFAQYLFDKFTQIERLIYVDGDMYVFGAFDQLSEAAITISPHRTTHVNYLPGLDNFSTTTLLKYGVYNAGYFELLRKPEALRFLSWWQQLLEQHAYNKPEEHIFTDQLWLSAVHSFFDDVFVNKNPGYNTGFWNLIERKVTKGETGWLVNDQPLILFHYSNYKTEAPGELVNFDHPLLTFEAQPALRDIFKAYRDGLLEAGYEKFKNLPYPFDWEPPAKKKKWWQRIFG
jgi:hypothetical protein